MKIFKQAQFKSLAATAAVIMAIAIPAQASCYSDCDTIARSYAESARSNIRANAASKCSTAPDQQACIANEYAYAESQYNYVYGQAYSSCTRWSCK